jgi:hypothetical protein
MKAVFFMTGRNQIYTEINTCSDDENKKHEESQI